MCAITRDTIARISSLLAPLPVQYAIELRGSGHNALTIWYDGAQKQTVFFPSTPSDSRRGPLNVLAEVRRALKQMDQWPKRDPVSLNRQGDSHPKRPPTKTNAHHQHPSILACKRMDPPDPNQRLSLAEALKRRLASIDSNDWARSQ
jgi:hypothetical protein